MRDIRSGRVRIWGGEIEEPRMIASSSLLGTWMGPGAPVSKGGQRQGPAGGGILFWAS